MKRIYLYVVSFLILMAVLYKIWPLPFDSFSRVVILPSVNVLSDLGQKIISPIRTIKNINGLALQNKDLQNENNLLKSELAKEDDTIKNNLLLSGEVAKDKNYQNALQAKVIGRTPGGLNSTLLLNKGLTSGIQMGNAVLSSGYFIGKVDQVETNKSEVTLIFSHNSLVPVIMSKNSDGGLLQGGLEGLTVTDIPISSKAETGDDVITSGLGGDLPSGLIIGKVGVHLGLVGDLFQKVKVDSPINPYQVNYVSILPK